MSHMGKARKIFNKKLAFPPYLFDKPRFSDPGKRPCLLRRERKKTGGESAAVANLPPVLFAAAGSAGLPGAAARTRVTARPSLPLCQARSPSRQKNAKRSWGFARLPHRPMAFFFLSDPNPLRWALDLFGFYSSAILTAVSSAISIICVKELWRSSAVRLSSGR